MKTFRSIVSVIILLAMFPLSLSRVLESMGQSSVVTLDVVLIPFELLVAIAICILSFRSSSNIAIVAVLLLVILVIDFALPLVPQGPIFGFGPHYVKVVPKPEVSYLFTKSYVLPFCSFLLVIVFISCKTKSKA